MQWLTLAGAVVGALIATVSAALLDRGRWRREQDERALGARKVLYGEYLTCLSQARNAFRSLGRDQGMESVERERSARDAFAPCYGVRYQIDHSRSGRFRRLRSSLPSAPRGSGPRGRRHPRRG